jgi:hypothetical protein
LRSAFHKISRVGSLTGATNWYLSDDCLLAAKRVMYVAEYRRFYLRDLESIVVWPDRRWLLRPIIPGVLFIALGASLWHWVNLASGAVAAGAGIVWAALELVLGPTAESRIRAGGASVYLPLVKRTRRARKILAKIDAALQAARGGLLEQPSTSVGGPQPARFSRQTSAESTPAAASTGDLA